MNGCWILLNAFFAFIEMIIWFFAFTLLKWCITLADLHMLNYPFTRVRILDIGHLLQDSQGEQIYAKMCELLSIG